MNRTKILNQIIDPSSNCHTILRLGRELNQTKNL